MNYIKPVIIFFVLSFSPLADLNSQTMFSDSSMIYIKGGTFYIGSKYGDDDEKNGNKVSLSEFFISKYEVTNKQYCIFLNTLDPKPERLNSMIELEKSKIYYRNKMYFVKKNDEDYPVNFVSWFGAHAFCEFYKLRLPTEAEWEFAAKSKRNSLFNKYYKYSGSNKLDNVAWYKYNSQSQVQKCGLKEANKFGLYDLSGNVDEWCNDWYLADYYSKANKDNPKGPENADFKVYRGGSWYNSKKMQRITNRRAVNPKSQKATIGFRVVKDVGIFCPVRTK